MAQYSQDQADQLLASGEISPDTHRMMVGNLAAPPMGGDLPIDPSWTGGGAAPAPPSPTFDPSVAHTTPTNVVNPLHPATSPFAEPAPAPVEAEQRPAPVPEPVASSPMPPPMPPVMRPAVATGPAMQASPAVPSGPSSDPRVNKRIAQYDKQYAPVEAARQDEIAAAGEVQRLEGERDTKQSEVANRFVMQSAIAQGEAAREEQNYQAEALAQRDRIKLAADEASRTKVDSGKFYKDIGIGGTIASAIAVAAGAYGAAMTHSENFAQKIIDNTIARDINAQEKNLDAKWKKVDSERGVLGDLRQVYGDKRVARADAFKRAYENSIAQGDAIAAQSKNPIGQARWQQLRAGLETQAKQHEFEVLQHFETEQKALDARAAGAARARAAEQRKFFMERYGKALDSAQKEIEDASKEGRPAAPWAVQTSQAAAANGIPMTGSDTGHTASPSGGETLPRLAGETRQEYGKRVAEHNEKSRAADSQDAQIERMKRSPVVTGSTIGASVAPGGGIGQRIAPGSAVDNADIDALNANMNSMGGKAIKDNEGRIPPAMLEQLHNFNIKAGDPPEIKQRKVQNFAIWLHDRQTETGARPLDAGASGPRAPVGPPVLPGKK